MNLPPLPPFPAGEVRDTLSPTDWEAALDVWNALTRLHLYLPPDQFKKKSCSDAPLFRFLLSYCEESRLQIKSEKETVVRKQVYLLTTRLFQEANTLPESVPLWRLVGAFCRAFARSGKLKPLLASLWAKHQSRLERELQAAKVSMIVSLTGKDQSLEQLPRFFDCFNPLLFACEDAARFILVGSDLVDAFSEAYERVSFALQKHMVLTLYVGLTAHMKGSSPNMSLVVDHLYSLKSLEPSRSGKPLSKAPSLLSDLISNTHLLSLLSAQATGPQAARVKPLLESFKTLLQPSARRIPRHRKRRPEKGKAPARDASASAQVNGIANVPVHRLSLITQVQDVFGDLGAGFISRLLEEYNEDAEQVISHILEDSLPLHLKNADRSEDLSHETTATTSEHGGPSPSKLPERRNQYDNDELDQLSVSTSKLYTGRRNVPKTADDLLGEGRTATSKSAIYSALAAFDADEDERDDTYDVADVGGTVDSAPPTVPDEVDADMTDYEGKLYEARRSNPDAFNRDAATRRSKARVDLKAQTNMTDEAIEGWALMLNRDPAKLRRLEDKYSLGLSGREALAPQPDLPRSSWHNMDDSNDSEGGTSSPRGRGRGRGAYRGRLAAQGGSSTGNNEAASQRDRHRKEANKGSRANHNRRDQRAKKFARGMS